MLLWFALACSPSGSRDGPSSDTGAATVDSATTDAETDRSEVDPGLAFDASAADALLSNFVVSEGLPSAAACVIGAGEVVWCGASGAADVEAGRAATPDTPYLLASLSKAVIGVAVTRLVVRGDVALDDPVEPIVGFELGSRRSRGAAITWRHLVTHTSGIRDNWGVMDRYYVDGDSPVRLGAFLRDYLDPDGGEFRASHFADHEPGARAVYSNIASALAAYAVERAVGQPFDDWCEAELFAPLGLENTGWHLRDFPPDTVAVPYVDGRQGLVPQAHYGVPDYPDGQLRSSARDVATFLADVSSGGGRWLPNDGVDVLLAPPLPQIDPLQGVFWYAEERRGVEVWGHNGGEVGASTDAFFDPLTGAGFVLLVNAEPRSAPMMALESDLLQAAIAASR